MEPALGHAVGRLRQRGMTAFFASLLCLISFFLVIPVIRSVFESGRIGGVELLNSESKYSGMGVEMSWLSES